MIRYRFRGGEGVPVWRGWHCQLQDVTPSPETTYDKPCGTLWLSPYLTTL